MVIKQRLRLTDLTGVAGLHPVIARVYEARAVTAEQLNLSLAGLPLPELAGLAAAVDLLLDVYAAQGRVVVCGDFDADGATSTALMVRALRDFGFKQVSYQVPDRFLMGYGLSPELVKYVLEQGKPDLLVTVDNGISSFEGVAYARAAGIKVLITDHHLPGTQMPEADAIVNPNQPGCPFPGKNLAGVGVAFYLLVAFRSRLQVLYPQQSWPNLANYLDLVALGTVADVVHLDHFNRILVEQGLRRMRAGKCGEGIAALAAISGRALPHLLASDLGFSLAPRLNAAGRLDDMRHGIACLLSDHPGEAKAMAEDLHVLNLERRDIEFQMQQQAQGHIARLSITGQPRALTLFDPEWHQGVVGILAGRIKERYRCPVVALADAGEGELKGSARSIPGAHMRDLLAWVDGQSPGLITRFGGHAMAAGLSLPRANWHEFSRQLEMAVETLVPVSAFQSERWHDGELVAQELDDHLARQLQLAGPWGQGFPEPLFLGEFLVLEQRILKERYLKLSVCLVSDNSPVDAMWFSPDLPSWPNQVKRVRMLYALDINRYKGREILQLRVEWAEPMVHK
ncbi:MAG: single-stranded-DNA-specific exonuclease RecJ [Pseudomonadales bacterium]|nr:single-stranded-DNA-specific exonuclease RecJ [Pseudomonadales bacterium]